MSRLASFKNGIIGENPLLVLTLGMCPALAVSTQASNALGMGIATTFVLFCANCTVSLLRRVIPEKVRIPCYIVLFAGFVTFVQMVVEAYAYSLHLALGIFLPLITMNCIIFARAEVFARKNTVLDSAIDALGMGAGFTLALLIMASIREILANGTWFGIALPGLADFNIPIMSMAPGGFVVFGCLIAAVNKLKGRGKKDFDCATCPSAQICGKGVR